MTTLIKKKKKIEIQGRKFSLVEKKTFPLPHIITPFVLGRTMCPYEILCNKKTQNPRRQHPAKGCYIYYIFLSQEDDE